MTLFLQQKRSAGPYGLRGPRPSDSPSHRTPSAPPDGAPYERSPCGTAQARPVELALFDVFECILDLLQGVFEYFLQFFKSLCNFVWVHPILLCEFHSIG
jgi:hypothetical protein